PRFVLRNRRLVLLPNPVACQEDIEKLKDLRFIISLGKHDHWYNRYNYPVKAFPYSRILFNKRMWRELISKTSGHVVDDINPRPWEDLWQDAETVDLMFAILEAFVRQCKTDGVVPILMVIPGKASVQSVLDTGEDVAAVRMIEEYCRRNGWLFINPVGGFVEHIRQGHPLSSLYTGHVSPTGNAVIADVVRRFLVEHGLFEESAPAGGAAGPP
ncbi:MAG: hypothetical protein KJ726_08095, partial [Verrucomicrobia bacterium]|nr:hypothetical protein [Verrucomicrobiota bacterium]